VAKAEEGAVGVDTHLPEAGEFRPTLTIEQYFSDRVQQYEQWYDGKASRMKKWYLRMTGTAVVAGALVPVLVNLEFDYATAITTILSITVVVIVSLESVLHFKEQWTNYRSAHQFLGNEMAYFGTRSGPYSDLEPEEANRLFVNRVEGAIAAANASTLKIMTLGEHGERQSEARAEG
jgi:hypothetical protein